MIGISILYTCIAIFIQYNKPKPISEQNPEMIKKSEKNN